MICMTRCQKKEHNSSAQGILDAPTPKNETPKDTTKGLILHKLYKINQGIVKFYPRAS